MQSGVKLNWPRAPCAPHRRVTHERQAQQLQRWVHTARCGRNMSAGMRPTSHHQPLTDATRQNVNNWRRLPYSQGSTGMTYLHCHYLPSNDPLTSTWPHLRRDVDLEEEERSRREKKREEKRRRKSRRKRRRKFRKTSEVGCEGAHPLLALWVGEGWLPIKLTYDLRRPNGRLH